ncbi:MAG: GTPase Era [Candidatus Levybacteria bacterium]|nr:GTPase Era [Candidatus Levybacteria bacterium]
MKSGTVALVGRPNAGKSTLLNALLGSKVSITSPKPQTTQFSVQAVYDDPRGQIIFTDTPGIFAKTDNPKAHDINLTAEHSLKEGVDVVVYVIDKTRERGIEENRVLGIIRKTDMPKILVINKIDKRHPDFIEQYQFMKEEFDAVVEVSARRHTNLNVLIDVIFAFLPEGEKTIEREGMATPILNMDSKLFLEEMIREKAFLRLRREVPYAIRVVVDSITEKPQKNLTVIKARILGPSRYKRMIIGSGGAKIKEIGTMTRRELELATNRKIYLELTVEEE